jgi:transcription initiation factor TFIIIB Brf1 subunit/transcription initiation factor TFIIB
MLPELVHQKFCKKNEMITDACTGEIACSSCGSVSSDIAAEL